MLFKVLSIIYAIGHWFTRVLMKIKI